MNHKVETQADVTTEIECIDIGANLTSKKFKNDLETVSYTHLTLPTNREV